MEISGTLCASSDITDKLCHYFRVSVESLIEHVIAIRVRALKVYKRHTQKIVIDFVNHIIEKFPFRIQQIRTDRVHEFQSRFHWHVEDLGICHVYIEARIPQLNGKAERSHRSDQQEFYQQMKYKDDVGLEA